MLEYKTKYKINTKIILFLLVAIFVTLHSPLIFLDSNYGHNPINELKDCSVFEIPHMRGPFGKWLICVSYKMTGNENVLPFVFSTGLIPLAFLVAQKITHSEKRALIAAGLLMFSPIISNLTTTAALSADWTFFLLLAVYAGWKRPELCGVFFFLSVAAKGLPMLVLPFILYFVLKSDMPQKKTAFISFAVAGCIILVIWGMGNYILIQEDGLRWNPQNFETSVHDLWHVFRSDPLQYALLPIALLMTWITKNPLGKPMFLFIMWFYSLVFLLPIFSMYVMFDYRMLPLIVFCAIGVTVKKC